MNNLKSSTNKGLYQYHQIIHNYFLIYDITQSYANSYMWLQYTQSYQSMWIWILKSHSLSIDVNENIYQLHQHMWVGSYQSLPIMDICILEHVTSQ